MRSSDDGGSYAIHPEDPDLSNATFCCPGLDSFCLLDRLGLTATGQYVRDEHAVLECRVLEPDHCATSAAAGARHWARHVTPNPPVPLGESQRYGRSGRVVSADQPAFADWFGFGSGRLTPSVGAVIES